MEPIEVILQYWWLILLGYLAEQIDAHILKPWCVSRERAESDNSQNEQV
jgi:hypothetical protein